MSPLFGGNNDEMKKVGEDMQKLSEQIGALQQKLAAKTSEADSLRTQAAQGAGASVALQDAEAQMEVLRNQLKEMSAQSAKSASSSAELDAARAQIQALQSQLSTLQQSASNRVSDGISIGGKTGASSSNVAATAPIAGGLAAGSSAWVTRAGGLPLRLRSGPGLSEKVLDRLQPGTQMTLKEGPQQADGHGWWHIRTTDGREGWVAGEDLRTQPD
jgi:uncharacterized protein YhaN